MLWSLITTVTKEAKDGKSNSRNQANAGTCVCCGFCAFVFACFQFCVLPVVQLVCQAKVAGTWMATVRTSVDNGTLATTVNGAVACPIFASSNIFAETGVL